MTVSDERLTQIRGRLANLAEIRDAAREDDMPAFSGLTPEQLCGIALAYEQDVPALLAEVERLRAALAVADNVIETAHEQDIIAGDVLDTLRDENAAMREIVRQVAEADNSDSGVCLQLCNVRWYEMEEMDIHHYAPCVVDRARALVAQWDKPND